MCLENSFLSAVFMHGWSLTLSVIVEDSYIWTHTHMVVEDFNTAFKDSNSGIFEYSPSKLLIIMYKHIIPRVVELVGPRLICSLIVTNLILLWIIGG